MGVVREGDTCFCVQQLQRWWVAVSPTPFLFRRDSIRFHDEWGGELVGHLDVANTIATKVVDTVSGDTNSYSFTSNHRIRFNAIMGWWGGGTSCYCDNSSYKGGGSGVTNRYSFPAN